MNTVERFTWFSRRLRLGVIIGVTLTLIGALLTMPHIPQDPGYNAFADRRSFLGLPNFLNVISNIPFFLVGMLGLLVRLRPRVTGGEGNPVFTEPAERWPFVVFFVGVALTALASGYYHLAPGNERLFWDRLPMTLVFMSFFAAVITERISVKAGLILLLPLLILGTGSALHWHYSELTGRGDLRLYAWVQFYPLLAIPLILLLFPPRYTRSRDLWGVLALYALAKVFEVFDENIYALGRIVSGHTLKHLIAAAATYWILQMLLKRRPLAT